MRVWGLLHVRLLYIRKELETWLSKQVFNMLSGSRNLPGKHTHTHSHLSTDTHKVRDTCTQITGMVLALVSVGFKETTREQRQDGAAKAQ